MNKPVLWFILLLSVLAVGLYFYFPAEEPVQDLPLTPQAAVEAEAAPAVRHPIPAAEPDRPAEGGATDAAEAPAPPAPLPALDDSDAPMVKTYEELFGAEALERWFYLAHPVRHLVVTVDNAGRSKMAMRQRPLKAVPGSFRVEGEAEHYFLHPDNYERYLPYVRLAEAVDLNRLVALYVRFYPLFQQAYEELGYPSAYFNDRFIDVIDQLLTTPEPRGSLALVRPHMLYQYADPELEALSAGQKVLVRVGPDNASRIKARLRELRTLLAAGAKP